MLMSSTLLTEKTTSSSAALVVGGESPSSWSSTEVSGDRFLERPPPRFRLRLVSLHIVELVLKERILDLEGSGTQGFINIRSLPLSRRRFVVFFATCSI